MPDLAHDPVVIFAARGAFALLFASAAWHKLRDRPAFAAVLAAYRVLPPSVVPVASAAVAVVELATAAAWLAPGAVALAARATIVLLATYAAAIGVNLARGRRTIDCGCAVGGGAQPIAPWLIARNALLAVAASVIAAGGTATVVATGPGLVAARSLGWVDGLTLAGILAVLAAVWTAAHGLAAAAARVRAVDARHAQHHGADA